MDASRPESRLVPTFCYPCAADPDPAAVDRGTPPGSDNVAPALQTQWDWRATGNFILGGGGPGSKPGWS